MACPHALELSLACTYRLSTTLSAFKPLDRMLLDLSGLRSLYITQRGCETLYPPLKQSEDSFVGLA